MRECAVCGAECDSALGLYRELKTEYWGGKKGRTIEYSAKLVSFFCSESHRNLFVIEGMAGGEIQTKRGERDLEA